MAIRSVQSLGRHGTKTQSSLSALGAKIALRKLALDYIGAGQASVLDLFSGDGEMHRAAWYRAANYAGCDLEWRRDGRLVWVCDNERLLRSINLEAFNIFDVDAFGEPWRQLYLLACRRKITVGEKVAVVVTVSMGKQMISKIPRPGKGSGLDQSLCRLAGINRDTVGTFNDRLSLLARVAKGMGEKMSAGVDNIKVATKDTGSPMVYATLPFVGVKESANA